MMGWACSQDGDYKKRLYIVTVGEPLGEWLFERLKIIWVSRT
jgi:hypothetical protein